MNRNGSQRVAESWTLIYGGDNLAARLIETAGLLVVKSVTLQLNEVTKIEIQFQNPKIVAPASRRCEKKQFVHSTGETPVPPISGVSNFWCLQEFLQRCHLTELLRFFECLVSLETLFFYFRDYDRLVSEDCSVTQIFDC
jgi:hypothetical protein